MVGTENQNFVEQQATSVQINKSEVMTKVFAMMFTGLMVTAIVAMTVFYTGFLSSKAVALLPILCIAEIVVVIAFSLLFKKLSPMAVKVLFYAYAILNGFTLSVIFAVYDLASIGYCFFGTAALFAGLAIYGKTTKRDVSKWGPILIGGLIIGLVLSLVNIFIGSSMLAIGIDWAIVAIFCGLTIYDIKKIESLSTEIDNPDKLYTYGAMELYLDFINIFLRILSLFGKRN